MFTTAAIALGGNVGQVPEVFQRALSRLDHLTGVQLVSRSRNFETHPVGDHAGGTFTNSVALLQTTFTPSQLLSHVQQIEAEFGRERGLVWGPRTLDIDVLSFGCGVVSLNALGGSGPEGSKGVVRHRPLDSYHGSLVIPHPAAWYRRFVLDPWCDVSPQWKHPVLGESVRELRDRLRKEVLDVSVVGGSESLSTQLCRSFDAAGIRSRLQLLDDQAVNPDLTLDFSGTPGPRLRSIALTETPSGIRMAVTILRAALDEPVAIAS